MSVEAPQNIIEKKRTKILAPVMCQNTETMAVVETYVTLDLANGYLGMRDRSALEQKLLIQLRSLVNKGSSPLRVVADSPEFKELVDRILAWK